MILKYRITCWSEKRKGLDFTQSLSANELKLPDNSWGYESSGNSYLKRVLSSFNISKDDSIIDIGSGKGHVLKLFSKYLFKKIDGIEFSPLLVDISRKNFERLTLKNITIYNTDATKFEEYKNYNYYYMFNPFQGDVMHKVISEIESSLKIKPRQVIIIYKNPMCHEKIIESGTFKKVNEFKTEYKYFNFFIYKN